jgi:glutaredoxin
MAAMDSKAADQREKADREDTTVQQRLKDAETAAKKAADMKGPKNPSPDAQHEVEAPGEKSVAGRKKMPVGEKVVKEEELTDEEKEEKKVEDEMNSILKRGPSMLYSPSPIPLFTPCPSSISHVTNTTPPVIIFSKSYCPHSARAKRILLDKYLIDPKPYVVELDQHDFGPQLQSLLAKNTGRKTVPNVLINGKSIGGGDETAALDESGELGAKVRGMGGKRIVGVELRSPAGKKD